MSQLQDRIRDKSLHSKITTPEKLVEFFKDGENRVLNLGWSGFTPIGYPKCVPLAVADYVEKNNLKGKWKANLFIGASIGVEIEDKWAELEMIASRWPYQTAPLLNKQINSGKVAMGDKHLSMFAQDFYNGFYTKDDNARLDIALIEASAIDENGNIILSGSVGCAPEFIMMADKIIVEINTKIPSFEGMHDIFLTDKPPYKKIIPITDVRQRVGTPFVPTDKSKIIGIVESNKDNNGRAVRGSDTVSDTIAQHIIDFFLSEVKAGRLPKNLLPLQSGVGSIANAIVLGLTNSPFEDLTVYSEVLQDGFLPFLDSGKCKFINATSVSLSNEAFEHWWKNYDSYKEKVLLRPMQISNNPEVVRRLGVISMNTPVECDIYGHLNSTLVGGTRMLNGIGGSGDFCRNGYLSIMHAPSVRASKVDEFGISSVVPKAPHVDHTEHDLDVFVTEQGLADLRGLDPKTRARAIINICAHPEYRDYLNDYLDRAIKETGGHHEPQLLKECYNMHINLSENGTMRFWNK